MKKITLLTVILLVVSNSGWGQIDYGRALKAGVKSIQAVSVTDAQIEQYVKEFMSKSDSSNIICLGNDPYAVRMEQIAGKFNNQDGINIKVYKVKDVNAFACADGSVRVYSGLMDIMTDEEILGVIGHEIGHVKNKDTKDAFRKALVYSAIREGLASTDSNVAKLTDSQVGQISEAFFNSKFSRKQEYEADNYGYDFLKKNGKNPWAMAQSFEKLHQMEQEAGVKTNAMKQLFSTHPDIVERTRRMAERAKKDGFTK